jgi:ATP-binding cassette subfamily B multidrug efflux pump
VIQDISRHGQDWRRLVRLLGYLRPHATLVGLSLITAIAGTGVELIQPWLTQRAIDDHLVSGDAAGLSQIALLLIGALIVGFACDYCRGRLLQTIGQRVVRQLRGDIYRHLQRLDLLFHARRPVGQTMTTATSDLDALNEMFSTGAMFVLGNLLTLIGTVIAMIAMNWRLAVLTFAVFPLAIWTTRWFQMRIRASYRRVRATAAELNGFMQESLAGMPTLQLFSQVPRALQAHEALNVANRDAGIASMAYFSQLNPAIEIISALSVALAVWLGGEMMRQGTVSVGVLVAFVLYLRRVFQPFMDLAEQASTVQAALAGSERIFALLDTPPRIEPPALPRFRVPAASERRAGRIEFDRVWFMYQDHAVLEDVSFVVEPGEHVGIAGPTGSGKTTVLNLMLRLYDVTRGRVLIDGVDIREWDERELRRCCSVVLQDSHVFPGTITGNIRGANSGASLEDVQQTARALGLHDLIASRPGGYEAFVSEQLPWSTGQKQLLSVARVMMSNADVVLLDEATSGLDSSTEAVVVSVLRPVLKHRTVVSVAHRLSTIAQMDRILTFHKGRLREAGRHEDLLAGNGIYSRLYRIQRSGES